MRIRWAGKAKSDLVRLAEFLGRKNEHAAARMVLLLVSAPGRLADHPRIGEALKHRGPEELRRIIVDDYEIQYEVRSDEIRIARIFHTREQR
jgi:addiction module RelE/StbE family toxin